MVVRPALGPLRRWDPERIGPYVLLGRLGAGAMGQVFLGRSTAGRLVAVKTIKIEFAEEAGFRARTETAQQHIRPDPFRIPPAERPQRRPHNHDSALPMHVRLVTIMPTLRRRVPGF